MKKILKNKKAFTLTELIVVIAIIGILAAVLIPSLTGYIEKAKRSSALQEAHTITSAYDVWLIKKESGMLETNEKIFKDYVKSSTDLDIIENKTGDIINHYYYSYKGSDKFQVKLTIDTTGGNHLIAEIEEKK